MNASNRTFGLLRHAGRLSALAAAAALCSSAVDGAGNLQARHRQLPLRPGGRELRHPGGERRQGGDRRLQQRHRARAVQQGRLRRRQDRADLRRRERRRDQAGAGAAQPVRPRQGRRGGRLRRLGRLPGGGAGGRRNEEVPHPLRLRHAAHLRGRQVPVRVPHRVARGDGQRRARAVPQGAQRQGRHHQLHQPGLRLGPRFAHRLQGGRRRSSSPARRTGATCCRSSAPASTAPRSRRCSRSPRTSRTPASGAATCRRSSCRRARAISSSARRWCSRPPTTCCRAWATRCPTA